MQKQLNQPTHNYTPHSDFLAKYGKPYTMRLLRKFKIRPSNVNKFAFYECIAHIICGAKETLEFWKDATSKSIVGDNELYELFIKFLKDHRDKFIRIGNDILNEKGIHHHFFTDNRIVYSYANRKQEIFPMDVELAIGVFRHIATEIYTIHTIKED